MPIGLGTALWAVVLPIDETNIFTNPSFEFGNIGAVAIQSATLGTSSAFQKYGAWSLQVTPNSNGTSGALLGTFTTGNGTAYSAGAWINAANGVPMRMGIADSAGVNLTSGTVTFTGGGTWQWYSCGTVEAAQGTRSLVVQKTSGNSVAAFYVDGVDVSPWADGTLRTTTYSDGDQPGGTWAGPQHASISYRSGQYRGGGSIVALADLGLQVNDMPGVGVMPIEVSTQSYAITDGAQFQRQRAAQRQFHLTAKPIVGTSLGDFHVTRRTLYDAFKPDLVTPQQPVRLLYYGAQGTQQIDAYYQSGLELGNMDGPIAENAAIGFVAPDPYWYAPTQQGTTLSPRTAIGSMNFMARRSALGKWGSVGNNGGPNAVVYFLEVTPTGTVFAAGSFTTLDGTVGARFMGQYYPTLNQWGTLIGGTASDEVGVLEYSPSGTLFFGGNFTTIAGTVGGKFVGRWNGAAMGTLQGGTVGGQVRALTYTPTGSLLVGGQYSAVNGTATSGPIGVWTGAAWGILTGGSLSNPTGVAVYNMLYAQDRSLYAAGSFNNAAGTTANHVARYANGTWGTMTGGLGQQIVTNTTIAVSLSQGPSGVVYANGLFGTIGGVVAPNIGQWNGVTLTPLGGGLGSIGATSLVYRAIVNQQNGNVLAVGANFGGSAGATNIPDDQAIWNGASWLPLDVDLCPGASAIQYGVYDQGGALYLAGSFLGTAQAASVGTIVNTGRSQVYPNLRIRNLSASGTGRIYQLLNVTTGNGIYFNYAMLPSEQITLVLQPGTRSFTSTSFGNIFNAIVPGSNLATWSLLPGTNYVSFFSDNDSLEAALFWGPRGWSIDSGTI